MSHSHLSIRHFLSQLDSLPNHRPRGLQLPDWLKAFIQEAADCFEPDRESARAGYVCSCINDGWMVQLFLGLTEVVGGPEDGANLPTGFRYDLETARHLFDEIRNVCWCENPDGYYQAGDLASEATAVISGQIGDQFVTLEVLHRPPADMGPGLLLHMDGRCEVV